MLCESIRLQKTGRDFGVMQKSHNGFQKNHWTRNALPTIMSYILASLPGISIESNFLDFFIDWNANRWKGGAMEHHLLNAHEAAEVLKMDNRTLIRWARLGQVPAHPMGEGKRKLWRFLEHELLDWVEARKAEKKGPLASRMELAISAHARRSA